jgi:hypothetical protein
MTAGNHELEVEMADMNKENWVQLFKDTGLTEEMMQKWHYPQSV